MDDVELELKVGATLRLEAPDGTVATFTVKQMHWSNGVSPDWVTSSPNSGRIALTLRAEDKPIPPEVFYLLVCLECGDPERPLPIPFGSPAERGKWAAAHTRGTGHDNWRVWDETRLRPAESR